MDGLIRGLADVALGGHDRRGGRDDEDNSRDERSRSTWADVVSGEEDCKNRAGGSSPPSHGRRQNLEEENQWEKKEERIPTRHSHKDEQEENIYAAKVTKQQDFSVGFNSIYSYIRSS